MGLFGKTTVQHDMPNNGGCGVTHKITKHQARSTAKPIRLTPAPKTAWQKFRRLAVG